MSPSLYITAVPFVVFLDLALTYFPMPVASLPIAAFQDRRVSNSSPTDDKLVFNVSLPLGTPRDRAIASIAFYLTSFQ